MSCAFSGLTQVEFISREISKGKYAKKNSFGKWGENGADYLEQPKWMLKSVSLSLEDIGGLLTDRLSFQGRNSCYSIEDSSTVNFLSLLNQSFP